MGDLVQRFCRTGNLGDIEGWTRVTGDVGALSTLLDDCSVYKHYNNNGNIEYINADISNYAVNPRYFSGSMDMKRKAITDRGIFGFAYYNSENGTNTASGSTIGGLAMYGYDNDNTDLYYYARDAESGGYHSKWFYLVNLESIDIDPYVYHTYRYMADLEAESQYNFGYYDGVTIDDIGTVCPPHDNYGHLNQYDEGNIYLSDVQAFDDNYAEDAWGGKNLTAYNIVGEKKFNRFPKWRKTSLGMRPFY